MQNGLAARLRKLTNWNSLKMKAAAESGPAATTTSPRQVTTDSTRTPAKETHTSAASKGGGRSFQQIMEDIRESTLAFEKPADLMLLLGYSISLFAALRVSIESGVFRVLATTSSPLTSRELGQKLDDVPASDTEESIVERTEFVSRMCRAVSGMQLIDEVGPGTYQGNELTRTLADPGFDLGMREMLDGAAGPDSTLSHMTTWGKKYGWKAPQRSTDGPFQRARGIVGTTTYDYFVNSEPQFLVWLSALMKVIHKGRLNWLQWFPADALFAKEMKADVPFIVDVGGNIGDDMMILARKYPDKKMRLVVEDLPSVIARTKKEGLDPRIESVEHNFFKEQPIKRAKIYFLHCILHNWPDHECVQILAHLRDAMAPDSRILINELIVSETNNSLQESAFDLTMLIQLGAKERSETMWERLICRVGGLQVKKYWQAPGLKGDGIIEVVRT